MGTIQSCNAEKNHQVTENRLLKRNSSSLHTLHPKSTNSLGFLERRWKFGSRQAAQEKYTRLKKKMQHLNYNKLLEIKDLEILKHNLIDLKKGQVQQFIVKAKMQFPRITMKSEIERRRFKSNKFTEIQLLIAIIQISECLVTIRQAGNDYIPNSLADVFLVDGKIKLKDPQLIPDIKTVTNKNKAQPETYSKKLCKFIISMSRLENKANITFQDIVRFNLEYSTGFSILLLRMNEVNISLQEIIADVKQLKRQKQNWEQNLKYFKKQFLHRKNSENILSSANKVQQNILAMTQLKQSKQSTMKSQRGHHSSKSSFNNVRPQTYGIAEQDKQNIYKQLFKKMNNQNELLKSNEQLLNIVKNSLLEDKQRSEVNLSQKEEINIQKNRLSSTKSSVEVDTHIFPKNTRFSKNSSEQSLTENSPKEQKKDQASEQSQQTEKNEKVLISTLFKKGDNQEPLLESIVDSQESIVIQDQSSKSPVRSLEKQMQEIMKQQEQQPSVLYFQQRFNSTIMQVTQEDSDWENSKIQGSKKSQKSKKSHSSKLDQYSSISSRKSNLPQPPQVNHSEFSHQQPNNTEQSNQENYVIEEYEGGSRYQGSIINGLRNGFGKLYYEDGGSYEGQWVDGQIQGFGKLYYQSDKLAYEGYWKKGEFHGQGKIINQMPEQYTGQFCYEDLSDIGIAWQWYQGTFENDQKHGHGTLTLSNGSKFTGIWHKNQICGDGIFVKKDGSEIVGRWQNNIFVDSN